MSEDNAKSDKGTSLGGLLLKICQINHTEKCTSHPIYLVICLFVYFETIARLLLRRGRMISISKECSLREGRGDKPTLAFVSLEVATQISGDLHSALPECK